MTPVLFSAIFDPESLQQSDMVLESGMRNNPYQNYFEDEILTADPLKLVILLYRGALDSVASARRHLASGDIRARSRSITKAMEIVSELVRSLDHERGGFLSHELSRLYEYVLNLFAESNTRQSDAPLAEAETLLSTLLAGWQGNYSNQLPSDQPPAFATRPATAAYQEAETELRRVSYAY